MKIALILLIGLIILLLGLLYGSFTGGFTKANTVILTQDGKYIGIECKTTFRFPWQESKSYEEVPIPWFNGKALIPSGDFNIYHTIENPKGFFECDGLLPDDVTFQDAINSLPESGNTIVFPQSDLLK
jgi:hypothetical protein